MSSIDLLICIRCYKHTTLTLDCLDAAQWATDPHTTKVVCAVDHDDRLYQFLQRVVDPERVYQSPVHWGWGAGLFSLLILSIEHFQNLYNFSHFLSIDIDTLFIQKEADLRILNFVTDEDIGMVGHYFPQNLHWAEVYRREERQFKEAFGKVPDTYIPGEGVQGGCMLLTQSFISAMKMRGMFGFPFREAKNYTKIADDHLLPIFCRMCRKSIVDAYPTIHSEWRMTSNPTRFGSEVVVFHPTKIRPGWDGRPVDLQVRNHFRKIRSQSPI